MNNSKEIEMLKKPRINKVVQAAKIEFDLYGIMNSKIKDIAIRAGVGEASVYRYFADKAELVDLVAFDYWSEKVVAFQSFVLSKISSSKSGFEQVLIIFDLFIDMYHSHGDIIKFMEDYENYQVISNPEAKHSSFEDYVSLMKKQTFVVIDRGYQDGTINPIITQDEIYEFFVLVLLPTIQNLSIRNKPDESNALSEQIRILDNLKLVFTTWIKNKAS